MTEATVADQLAFDALPDEVKELARRVITVFTTDREEDYNEGYKDGNREVSNLQDDLYDMTKKYKDLKIKYADALDAINELKENKETKTAP